MGAKASKPKTTLKTVKTRFSSKYLTSAAGLVPIHRFWIQLGAESRINEQLGDLKGMNSAYSVGTVLTIIIMSFLSGARHISDHYCPKQIHKLCHVLKKVDTFPFSLLPLPERKEARRATGVPAMANPILILMPPIDGPEMVSGNQDSCEGVSCCIETQLPLAFPVPENES